MWNELLGARLFHNRIGNVDHSDVSETDRIRYLPGLEHEKHLSKAVNAAPSQPDRCQHSTLAAAF